MSPPKDERTWKEWFRGLAGAEGPVHVVALGLKMAVLERPGFLGTFARMFPAGPAQALAGAPVLLIPESSCSPRLIVANLGQLRIRNRFLTAGSHGTFSLWDKVEKLTMVHCFFPSLVSPVGTPSLQAINSPLCTSAHHLITVLIKHYIS